MAEDRRQGRGLRRGPRTWRAVRRAPFTDGSFDAHPACLRHAGLATWLHGGVPTTQVAEWAGHNRMNQMGP
ncbi:MAG: hypothetical protein M3Y48_05265 [Actinomycetota bacterium]|nr:hypothetical protein [Actinomycetota bacterium]